MRENKTFSGKLKETDGSLSRGVPNKPELQILIYNWVKANINT